MPPMYRESPFWYKRNYTQICASFSAAFRNPDGCTYVLPSYSNPSFEKDGIHLTEDDGVRLVVLFFLPVPHQLIFRTVYLNVFLMFLPTYQGDVYIRLVFISVLYLLLSL